MSLFENLRLVEVEAEPELCRICGGDGAGRNGVVYCDCVIDEEGNTLDDCGACSDGLICVACDNHLTGLEWSIRVFY
jgi:hypothetical protein